MCGMFLCLMVMWMVCVCFSNCGLWNVCMVCL